MVLREFEVLHMGTDDWRRNWEELYCHGVLHIVEKGDTLYKIAKKYGVPLSRVMYANPYVDVYNLQPGDEICVPMARQPRGMEDRSGEQEAQLRPQPLPEITVDLTEDQNGMGERTRPLMWKSEDECDREQRGLDKMEIPC